MKNKKRHYITKDLKNRIDIAELLISQSFSIDQNLIYKKNRNEQILNARWTSFYILYKLYNLSFSMLSRMYKFDRSTIMNAVKNVEDDRNLKSISIKIFKDAESNKKS